MTVRHADDFVLDTSAMRFPHRPSPLNLSGGAFRFDRMRRINCCFVVASLAEAGVDHVHRIGKAEQIGQAR